MDLEEPVDCPFNKDHAELRVSNGGSFHILFHLLNFLNLIILAEVYLNLIHHFIKINLWHLPNYLALKFG